MNYIRHGKVIHCGSILRKTVSVFLTKNFLFSYGDIYQYALQAAQGLRAIGVKKGSHIAVCMNNIPEYIALIFAIAKVGGVKVSVNTNVGEDEMQYIVDKADVEYCFCQGKRLLPILKNIGKIKKIVSMDEEDNGICSWKDFLRMRCSETEDVGDEKIDIHDTIGLFRGPLCAERGGQSTAG